jgi:hypothetical protein
MAVAIHAVVGQTALVLEWKWGSARMDHGHHRSDARNLHLHEAALSKLREEPSLRARCLALLETWLPAPGQQSVHEVLEQWKEMLTSWGIDQIARLVLDETEGQVLRQCSPLGPLLTPQERWALLAEIDRLTARANQEPQ